jgi:two-component system phosphate regulon sensor histidine kinase PhoR
VSVRLLLSVAGISALALLLHAALLAAEVPGPGAIVLIVCFALAAVLALLLERPIRRAASFAAQLSHGELPPRLPETALGTIGDLFRAMNRLAEAHRTGLEERGAEKTETEVLLREMGEGVLALDSEGLIVRVNAELQSIIGAADVVTGHAAGTVFRNPQLVTFLSPATVPEEGHTDEFEVFGRTMLVTARRLPAGGVVAVFSDMTELRRLDRVRTEFVANASHELKTPLTAIRGFAETVADASVPEADRAAFANRIVGHSERMAAIVDDLLTLARLEDRSYTILSQRVSIRPLAERILEGFAQRIEAAGTSVTLAIEPPDLELNADPEGLRQILENTIDNAIRHSGSTELHVKASERPSGSVRLSVEDNGQGIPAAHLERVFERFYRADPSRSRATGGTGLGLAIVKHWVEQMGGRVSAESSVGQGMRIQVEFPTL